MVSTFLFLSAALLSGKPAADVDTSLGASLVRGCQAELRLMALESLSDAAQIDLINGAYCVGYLNGFTASLEAGPALICTHDESMGAMVRAYVAYMERNPPLLDADKRVGLRRALQEAYPCSLAR